MKKKTILVAAIAVMLVAALVVGGTLAYFTDKTDAKQNTFTVGSVGINLTEDKWNAADDHTLVPGAFYEKNPTITVDANSQDAYVFLKLDLNKYVSLVNLMGVDAYKNNVGGLEGNYPGFVQFVSALVNDNTLRAAVLDRWFVGVDHSAWKVMNVAEIQAGVAAAQEGNNPAHLVVVLGYQKDGGIVSANQSVTFMDKFGMPSSVTASMFDGEDAYRIDGKSKSNFNTDNAAFKMTFTAYAVQANTLNLDTAYAALGNITK